MSEVLGRHKRCTRCGKKKTLREFARDAQRPDGRRSHCRTCLKAHDAKRYKTDPERRARMAKQHRAWALKSIYGITEGQLDALYTAQDGRCAICGTRGTLGGRRDGGLHIDHDHDTEAVRGLLCGRCNGGLGLFADSAERLAAAISYLRERR